LQQANEGKDSDGPTGVESETKERERVLAKPTETRGELRNTIGS